MLQAYRLFTSPFAPDSSLDLDQLDAIVAWNDVPRFEKPGRSAILELPAPVAVETPRGPVHLHFIKLKGVGLGRHDGEVQPPAPEPYHRLHPHLGFTRDGELTSLLSAPAPLGGIVVPMASAEYLIAQALLTHCPAQIPISVYRYDEPSLLFQTGNGPLPLGAVVSGIPSRSRLRVESVFGMESAAGEHRAELEGWSAALGIEPGPLRELRLLKELGHLYTRTIRRFHEAGFYRYSGQPDNYALAPERNEVFLVDLDSSRPLSECSRVETPLQLMRDMTSALYGLTVFMLRRENIQRFAPQKLRQQRFYEHMLAGYYFDVQDEQIGLAAERLYRHYSRAFDEAQRRHEAAPLRPMDPAVETYDEYRRRIRHQTWIERDETLTFFLANLWHLHAQCGLSGRYPHARTLDDILSGIALYASPATACYVRTELSLRRDYQPHA